MAYDEVMADRLREILEPYGPIHEMKIFGGLAFLRLGHMVTGVMSRDRMILRLDPDEIAQAIAAGEARPFMMQGRQAKGFAVIENPSELDDEPLAAFVARCIRFVDTLPPKAG